MDDIVENKIGNGKSDTEKNHEAIRVVIGVVISIIIWIALWQLSEIHINKRSVKTQTIIYVTVLVVVFLVLFWLAKKHPSCIGIGH